MKASNTGYDDINAWIDSIKDIPQIQQETFGFSTMEEKIRYQLLDCFHTWFRYNIQTIGDGKLISLHKPAESILFELPRFKPYPRYIIQLQDWKDKEDPGKSIFFAFYGADYRDDHTVSKLLEELKEDCGNKDKAFVVLDRSSQLEVVSHMYVPEAQPSGVLPRQYQRNGLASHVLGGQSFNTEIRYLAVVWKKLEVYNPKICDVLSLGDLVKWRKEFGSDVAHHVMML